MLLVHEFLTSDIQLAYTLALDFDPWAFLNMVKNIFPVDIVSALRPGIALDPLIVANLLVTGEILTLE
jgi:hypothetical protein